MELNLLTVAALTLIDMMDDKSGFGANPGLDASKPLLLACSSWLFVAGLLAECLKEQRATVSTATNSDPHYDPH